MQAPAYLSPFPPARGKPRTANCHRHGTILSPCIPAVLPPSLLHVLVYIKGYHIKTAFQFVLNSEMKMKMTSLARGEVYTDKFSDAAGRRSVSGVRLHTSSKCKQHFLPHL